jgi:hypothetical protein
MYDDVVATLHDDGGYRGVKIIKQPDGRFGLREFRRDPEDAGRWTLVGDYPGICGSEAQARAAASTNFPWLRPTSDRGQG